mgnify:CR=1 FL=1
MIGIFGSAFNPPTRGHLDGIIQALGFCEEVWLVPSISHAYGKKMLSFDERISMVEAFVQDINDDRVKVSDLERELWDGTCPVYTICVAGALQSRYPDKEFAFLFGPDNVLGLSGFEGAELLVGQNRIISLCDRSNIRSTDVRTSRYFGDPFEHLVTPGVFNIIQEKRYYGQ